MKPVEWADIAEYVAAGNLDKVSISEDFSSVSIEVVYLGTVSHSSVMKTATIVLDCIGCCYFDLRRREDHEPGSGIILDAYLRAESKMIDALRSHQLDSVAGCLCLETGTEQIYHLEIIGEVSLNVLCRSVSVTATPVSETE